MTWQRDGDDTYNGRWQRDEGNTKTQTNSCRTEGNCSSGHTSHSMVDFSILKSFRVNGHVNKAPKIIQVTWYPPLQGWIKCNTDGACRGSSGLAACGGWQRIWLECDSTSEVAPFSSVVSVPWRIWNRWKRCIDLRKSMNFVVSLSFREGNDSADKLAIYGLDNMGFIRRCRLLLPLCQRAIASGDDEMIVVFKGGAIRVT
ncbi:hypothetical protein JHK87_050738 [Glycine soja]|nr:hypothetical protein JHK87_050738 [Glycine soja]